MCTCMYVWLIHKQEVIHVMRPDMMCLYMYMYVFHFQYVSQASCLWNQWCVYSGNPQIELVDSCGDCHTYHYTLITLCLLHVDRLCRGFPYGIMLLPLHMVLYHVATTGHWAMKGSKIFCSSPHISLPYLSHHMYMYMDCSSRLARMTLAWLCI